MAAEIVGEYLNRLEDPIRTALIRYQEISDNGLVFDANSACRLTATPVDKPNSARSTTAVIYREEKIGDLYVIAFEPGDGTGDERTHHLADLRIDAPYKDIRKPSIVPRDKTGVHEEAHLAIVRHGLDVHAEPEMFAGTYDLVGLDIERIIKIGELGHSLGEKDPKPVATFTVGYTSDKKRFGDPHAVYNAIPDAIQVCAFLAISDKIYEEYEKRKINILSGLSPQFPRKSQS